MAGIINSIHLCGFLNPFFNQAMVGWFPGWRSDRCADFRADGIKKWHFCFIFLVLPICRVQNFFWIENRTIIYRDTAVFVQPVQIFHEPFENKSQNFIILSLFLFLPFFFLPTDRLEIVQIGKNYLYQNFILFFYFRPTNCMKRAHDKSAIQGINWPWPHYIHVHALFGWPFRCLYDCCKGLWSGWRLCYDEFTKV